MLANQNVDNQIQNTKTNIKGQINTPCSAVLGHVDVGKTKLLDYMRSTATLEASEITQQIGTTLYNRDRLEILVGPLLKSKIGIDSLLMIDTPGHECFDMIRYVAMRVADVVILMVDIIKGLEKQTISVINLLVKLNVPFIVCLNKMDKIYGWKKPDHNEPLHLASVLRRIEKNKDVYNRFHDYIQKIQFKLYEYDVFTELYYKNKTPDTVMNIVPISAETGEGVPDLIMLISTLAQKRYLSDKIIESGATHGYILDSHYDKQHGRYHVALHRGGVLNKGDVVVMNVKNAERSRYLVKHILVNTDNRELKDDHSFIRIDSIERSIGYGLILEPLNGNDDVVEPSSIYIKDTDLQQVDMTHIKYTGADDYVDRWRSYTCKKGEPGIQIVAPSHIMMDGLFHMLRENKDNISVERYKVGKIDKRELIVSGRWADRENDPIKRIHMKRYCVILSYDPSKEELDKELLEQARQHKVTIIHSNVVYKLIEFYEKHIQQIDHEIEIMTKHPIGCVKILPQYVFRTSDPIIVGVTVLAGVIKTNSELYLGTKKIDIDRDLLKQHSLAGSTKIGNITSIQKDRNNYNQADTGSDVCIKIDSTSVIEKDISLDTIIYAY